MTLKDNLTLDLKTAMKDCDKVRVMTVRSIKDLVSKTEKDEPNIVMDDKRVLELIGRLIKQRKDSIEQFKSRQDLVDSETAQLNILQSYMPAQLSTEEISVILTEIVSKFGMKGMKMMGMLIAEFNLQYTNRADMKEVSSKAKELLNS